MMDEGNTICIGLEIFGTRESVVLPEDSEKGTLEQAIWRTKSGYRVKSKVSGVEYPLEKGEIIGLLREDIAEATNSYGQLVWLEYVPYTGDEIAIAEAVDRPPWSWTALANQFGERMPMLEKEVLRLALSEKGHTLWQLPLEQARALVSAQELEHATRSLPVRRTIDEYMRSER